MTEPRQIRDLLENAPKKLQKCSKNALFFEKSIKMLFLKKL